MSIVHIFPPICSCGRRLGKDQYLFEKTLDQYRKQSSRDAFKQTIESLGWTLMCCRNNVMSPWVKLVNEMSDYNSKMFGNDKILPEDPQIRPVVLERIELKRDK